MRAAFVEHSDKNTKRLNCLVWLPFNLSESKDSAQFSFSRQRASSAQSPDEDEESDTGQFEEVEFQSHDKRDNASCSIEVKEESV